MSKTWDFGTSFVSTRVMKNPPPPLLSCFSFVLTGVRETVGTPSGTCKGIIMKKYNVIFKNWKWISLDI